MTTAAATLHELGVKNVAEEIVSVKIRLILRWQRLCVKLESPALPNNGVRAGNLASSIIFFGRPHLFEASHRSKILPLALSSAQISMELFNMKIIRQEMLCRPSLPAPSASFL